MATYHDAARRKGLRLGSGRPSEVTYRAAAPGDATALARLHADSIGGGFLPTLGHRFLSRLYRALIDWPGADVVVAATADGPVGFVAGAADTGAFYRHFAKHHGPQAALAAGYRLAKPSTIRRAIETLRYDGGDVDVAAELLSMAVAADVRGAGVGAELGSRFLKRMGGRGINQVRVVVGAENGGAIRFYRRLGFVDTATIEVHGGTPSELLIWRA